MLAAALPLDSGRTEDVAAFPGRLYAVVFRGPYLLTRALAPLIEVVRAIVNVASSLLWIVSGGGRCRGR